MKKISSRVRNKKITLYNYLATTAGVASYQRTVVDLIYLDTGYAQRLSNRGIATADKAQVIIDLRGTKTTENRKYVPYKDWQSLTDKGRFFTFSTANDFFIEGEGTEELPTFTKQQMQAKYQCFGISSISSTDADILQIIGR